MQFPLKIEMLMYLYFCRLATILDPNYKDAMFTSNQNFNNAFVLLKNELVEKLKQNESSTVTQPPAKDCESKTTKNKSSMSE